MSRRQTDWLSRVTIPDVYPRRDDPFRPPVLQIPGQPPPDVGEGESVPISQTLTVPGQRPYVYQRAVNFQVSVGLTPVDLVNNRFECDTIVINNPSTNLNSVFFGYGSSITTLSGQEVRPGIPLVVQPENTREQWELQRSLELIAALLANDHQIPDLGVYRAPRVVFDASAYNLVAGVAGPTVVAVMLFYIPEQQ